VPISRTIEIPGAHQNASTDHPRQNVGGRARGAEHRTASGARRRSGVGVAERPEPRGRPASRPSCAEMTTAPRRRTSLIPAGSDTANSPLRPIGRQRCLEPPRCGRHTAGSVGRVRAIVARPASPIGSLVLASRLQGDTRCCHRPMTSPNTPSVVSGGGWRPHTRLATHSVVSDRTWPKKRRIRHTE
jgi:hypothetical protein